MTTLDKSSAIKAISHIRDEKSPLMHELRAAKYKFRRISRLSGSQANGRSNPTSRLSKLGGNLGREMALWKNINF